jgi:hypothetical protein
MPRITLAGFAKDTSRRFILSMFGGKKIIRLLAFNLKSLNNNASALNEARSQSAGVRSALKNV